MNKILVLMDHAVKVARRTEPRNQDKIVSINITNVSSIKILSVDFTRLVRNTINIVTGDNREYIKYDTLKFKNGQLDLDIQLTNIGASFDVDMFISIIMENINAIPEQVSDERFLRVIYLQDGEHNCKIESLSYYIPPISHNSTELSIGCRDKIIDVYINGKICSHLTEQASMDVLGLPYVNALDKHVTVTKEIQFAICERIIELFKQELNLNK